MKKGHRKAHYCPNCGSLAYKRGDQAVCAFKLCDWRGNISGTLDFHRNFKEIISAQQNFKKKLFKWANYL